MIFAGALVAIFLGTLIFNRRKAKKLFRLFIDKYGFFIAVAFLVGIATDLAGFPDSFLYDDCLNFVVGAVLCLPFRFMIKGAYEKKEKTDKEHNVEKNFDASDSERVRIVSDFSEKYRLQLTETQIRSIVDGSFQSKRWEDELRAMEKKYDSENEWYKGETDWLRVYLKSLSIQNISSDFDYQSEICLNTFDEIFREINPASFASIDDCVYAINNKYMTTFTEAGFMVAYRFLQRKGKLYDLPVANVFRVQTEIDDLTEKYDNERTEQLLGQNNTPQRMN